MRWSVYPVTSVVSLVVAGFFCALPGTVNLVRAQTVELPPTRTAAPEQISVGLVTVVATDATPGPTVELQPPYAQVRALAKRKASVGQVTVSARDEPAIETQAPLPSSEFNPDPGATQHVQ